jgi:hypothetical protein|tara:strand:- start:234 stop:521 length:288 start_codon:yes stop_codon:yes gene_type:complete
MQIIDPENPTVVLDGEHHVIEKMDDNGKYYVDQIKDLNTQMIQLRAKMHQVEMARAGFVELLRNSLEAQEDVHKEDAPQIEIKEEEASDEAEGAS